MELRSERGFECKIGPIEPKKPRLITDRTPVPAEKPEREEITGEDIELTELKLEPAVQKALKAIKIELQTSPRNILAAQEELFEIVKRLPSSKMSDQQLENKLMSEAKKIIDKHQTRH